MPICGARMRAGSGQLRGTGTLRCARGRGSGVSDQRAVRRVRRPPRRVPARPSGMGSPYREAVSSIAGQPMPHPGRTSPGIANAPRLVGPPSPRLFAPSWTGSASREGSGIGARIPRAFPDRPENVRQSDRGVSMVAPRAPRAAGSRRSVHAPPEWSMRDHPPGVASGPIAAHAGRRGATPPCGFPFTRRMLASTTIRPITVETRDSLPLPLRRSRLHHARCARAERATFPAIACRPSARCRGSPQAWVARGPAAIAVAPPPVRSGHREAMC